MRLLGYKVRCCLSFVDWLTYIQFEAILVVSANTSNGGEEGWRVDDMIRAANFTGLEISVPIQPNFTEAQINAALVEDYRPRIGTGLSRLGPLNVLQQYGIPLQTPSSKLNTP